VRASDFARWAGPRAAHIQNGVTSVTCRQESSVPAVIKPGLAVTTATEVLVTAVTETEPAFTSVSPAAMGAAAKLAERHSDDPCARSGDQGDREIEPPSTVREEERAAIIEHDAGIPRAWAEGFACLDPARPPADVPLRRWQQFIDDVGRFLDSAFAEKATAFGWEAFDIFGCDRDRPFARIDRQGLCWLVTGNRIVNLFENAAVIQTWTGQRQTWRRKPSAPGRVLAWELADGEPTPD
jgi:hypothetical protein